ncbi:MAG: heavy-metal-associated domain-containing protein [Desulfobacterales bacterium]
METTTLSVPKISCGHCVMTIKEELSGLEGVKGVQGDPENKNITVEWETPASLEKIKDSLKKIDYPVV